MHTPSQAYLAHRRVTEWMLQEQARRSQEEHRQAAPSAVRTVITISRQYGAGGHAIGTRLVEMLGPDWQLWDRELLDAIAQSAQVRQEMVEAMDEHTQSWITNVIEAVFHPLALESHAYRQHLFTVLLAVAQQGRKIILGRGANFVLPDALNVRLRASEEFRVLRTMERLGLDRPHALRLTRQTDKERAHFIRSTFGKDVEDPTEYDMVIQTDHLGMDAAAAAIIAVMNQRLTLHR